MQNLKSALETIRPIYKKRCAIISLVLWIVLNICQAERLFFNGPFTEHVPMIKLLHLVFLYAIFYKIDSLVISYKTKQGKLEFFSFAACFLLFIVFFLLMYPGTWSWDDIYMMINAQSYSLNAWQHFFSGLFYLFCLQTLPFAPGVIFIQILIVSLISSYCSVRVALAFSKSEKHTLILTAAFTLVLFAPPMLLYVMSGFRMGLYAMFELLLICKLILAFKNKAKLSALEWLAVFVLTIIVCSWRTEAIYYPILVFFLFIIAGRKFVSKKMACLFLATTLVVSFGINNVNNTLIGNSDYSISASIGPASKLVLASDDGDSEEIAAINRVLDVEYIKANPGYSGEAFFWSDGAIRSDYTEDDVSAYNKAVITLSLKHPGVVIKHCFGIFKNAILGFGENGKQTTRNMIFAGSNGALEIDTSRGESDWNLVNSKFKNPINNGLRKSVILFLAGVDEERNISFLHTLFWNLWIPAVLILIALAYKIFKRDLGFVLIICTVLCRIPILFLTSPAPYFMYYLSTYVCLIFICVLVFYEATVEILEKRKNKAPAKRSAS